MRLFSLHVWNICWIKSNISSCKNTTSYSRKVLIRDVEYAYSPLHCHQGSMNQQGLLTLGFCCINIILSFIQMIWVQNRLCQIVDLYSNLCFSSYTFKHWWGPVATLCTTCCNIKEFYILPRGLFMNFLLFSRINTDYFHKCNLPFGFQTARGFCFLWSGIW